jgi:hypothetical protein
MGTVVFPSRRKRSLWRKTLVWHSGSPPALNQLLGQRCMDAGSEAQNVLDACHSATHSLSARRVLHHLLRCNAETIISYISAYMHDTMLSGIDLEL